MRRYALPARREGHRCAPRHEVREGAGCPRGLLLWFRSLEDCPAAPLPPTEHTGPGAHRPSAHHTLRAPKGPASAGLGEPALVGSLRVAVQRPPVLPGRQPPGHECDTPVRIPHRLLEGPRGRRRSLPCRKGGVPLTACARYVPPSPYLSLKGPFPKELPKGPKLPVPAGLLQGGDSSTRHPITRPVGSGVPGDLTRLPSRPITRNIQLNISPGTARGWGGRRVTTVIPGASPPGPN